MARVAFARPDRHLAALLRPDPDVLRVCAEMIRETLGPEQVLCMAPIAAKDAGVADDLSRHLHGRSAATCRAAAILQRGHHLVQNLATADAETSIALASLCTNPADALAILHRAPGAVHHFPLPVYAALWLHPSTWPLLLASSRKGMYSSFQLTKILASWSSLILARCCGGRRGRYWRHWSSIE